jgi:hypothetical protein
MATVTMDGPNLRIELDHQETEDFVNKLLPGSEAAMTAFLKAVGVPVFAVGVVAAALVLHAAWEIPAIKNADKGSGVFLTAPLFPLGGVILIPSTRYVAENDGWSSKPETVIGSTEGDIIETLVEQNGDPQTVVFRLRNQCESGWEKAFLLRDGLGGEWFIKAPGFGQAQEGLWADQVRNGQALAFWKPKFAYLWKEIFSVRDLDKLAPGSVVTFTWVRDH